MAIPIINFPVLRGRVGHVGSILGTGGGFERWVNTFAIVCQLVGVALAQLVDVCLVDRDGLLHRLVQRSPLVVGTHEAVIR